MRHTGIRKVIRPWSLSRKTKPQYVSSEKDGKATGW
ncbi:hypothetical protein ACNKHM_28910 [Shigella sonnei]